MSERESWGLGISGEIFLGPKTPPHPAVVLCIGGQALVGGRRKLHARCDVCQELEEGRPVPANGQKIEVNKHGAC